MYILFLSAELNPSCQIQKDIHPQKPKLKTASNPWFSSVLCTQKLKKGKSQETEDLLAV